MKKTVRIISLLIVISMMLFAFASCGKTPASERIETAMKKMSDSKIVDSDTTMKMVMSMQGMTIEVPMTMKIKGDMRDEKAPALSVDMEMSIMGEKMEVGICYVDGIAYLNMMGSKIKTKASDSDLEEIFGSAGLDSDASTELFFDSEMISKAEITEEKDGSFTAKVTIDGKEYKDAIMEEIGSLIDSIGEEGDIELGETVVVIGVDKDDNVVSYSMKINLKMNIEGIATDATVDMDMKFNAVGDDFKIGAPADAASYIDSSEMDY